MPFAWGETIAAGVLALVMLSVAMWIILRGLGVL